MRYTRFSNMLLIPKANRFTHLTMRVLLIRRVLTAWSYTDLKGRRTGFKTIVMCQHEAKCRSDRYKYNDVRNKPLTDVVKSVV